MATGGRTAAAQHASPHPRPPRGDLLDGWPELPPSRGCDRPPRTVCAREVGTGACPGHVCRRGPAPRRCRGTPGRPAAPFCAASLRRATRYGERPAGLPACWGLISGPFRLTAGCGRAP